VRWRAASLAQGWPVDELRWGGAEVLAVADWLASRIAEPTLGVAACRALGEHRAATGASLDEGRVDLRVGIAVAGLAREAAVPLVDALIDGWVDHSLGEVFAADCIDPQTELATVGYLATRLGELYRLRARSGPPVRRTHVLAIARCGRDRSPFQQGARLIALSQALRRAFSAGSTIARLGPSTAAALVERSEPGPSRAVEALRADLARAQRAGQLPVTRFWLERPPANSERVTDWLRALHR
jgi:hypothetical protein